MTEEFIRANFCEAEIAKQMRELGFNEPCIAKYSSNPGFGLVFVRSRRDLFVNPHLKSAGTFTAAPTYWQAIQWLDSQSIFIDIDHEFGEDWTFTIDLHGSGHSGDDTIYPNRLAAAKAAIDKALSILKQHQNTNT